MSQPDPELVHRARRGDRAAFDRLVERHGPDLLKFLTSLTRRRDDALDLFQDSFLAAFRSLGTLRDPAAFRSWIATIATNCFRKRARRLALDPHDFDVDRLPAAEVESTPSSAERREQCSLLRAAIADLPQRQRTVLSLRLDLGLPFQQIAKTLGIHEENARAHHYQALKSLRKKLPSLATRVGDAP